MPTTFGHWRKTVFLKCALAFKNINPLLDFPLSLSEETLFCTIQVFNLISVSDTKINIHAYVFVFVKKETFKDNLVCTSCSHFF